MKLFKTDPKKLEIWRKYYYRNRRRLLDKQKKTRLENPEKSKEKSLDYYYRNRDKQLKSSRAWKDRNRDRCNTYSREWKKSHGGYMRWHLENPEKSKEIGIRYRLANRDRLLAKARISANEYRKNNPQQGRLWKQKNRAKLSAIQMARQAIKIKAMPPWVDKKSIYPFYEQAHKMSLETGIKHHVDHIWPLQGIGFTGLHVPWNLQVIPATINISKHNKRPDQFVMPK